MLYIKNLVFSLMIVTTLTAMEHNQKQPSTEKRIVTVINTLRYGVMAHIAYKDVHDNQQAVKEWVHRLSTSHVPLPDTCTQKAPHTLEVKDTQEEHTIAAIEFTPPQPHKVFAVQEDKIVELKETT